MVEIEITDHMKKIARQASDKMSNLYNHQGLRELDAAYNGILGELAFVTFLMNNKKWFHYEHDYASGKPDNGDVKIWVNGLGTVTVDVKTASKSSYQYLLVPKTQKKYMLYVAVRLNGDIAEIWGIAKLNELRDVKAINDKINNIGLPLDSLKDLRDILDHIQ